MQSKLSFPFFLNCTLNSTIKPSLILLILTQKNPSIENLKYMTNCLRTKAKGADLLKAAVHPADFTCRAQLLDKKDNKSYYDLINAYGKKTGNFALLNTSLNFHGFPLANDIYDAYKIVDKSNLDGLILENFLVVKKGIKI